LFLCYTGPVADTAALEDASWNDEIHRQHGQAWSGNAVVYTLT